MKDNDRKILCGMLKFARRVSKRINGLSYEEFNNNDDLQDAILYALGQLGEKAHSLSNEFIESYPRDEWYKLRGLRNRLFHSYDDINLQMVYEMATDDIDTIVQLLSELTGETT